MHVDRSGKVTVTVVSGVVLLYVVSFGPVLRYWVYTQEHQVHTEATRLRMINAVITVYRPLSTVTPRWFICQYLRLCGLSELEAFILAETMRSGSRWPDVLKPDEWLHE